MNQPTPNPDDLVLREALLVLLSRMLRGVLLPAERPLLREHVEAVLADRDRLAQPPARCQPGTAGPDHPVAALTDALTAGQALDGGQAGDLIRRYYDAIHAACCPLEHTEPRPGRAAEANRAALEDSDT